jgi:hypothetical protein
MTIEQILEFIILPVLAWLLINSNRNTARLSRIETSLTWLMRRYKISPSDNDED